MARNEPVARSADAGLLRDPRYELLPFEGFDEQVSHVPAGGKIAITASPTKGQMETIDRAEDVAERGYEVIPHVAARAVTDEDNLEEIVGRLKDAGVTDIFVPGGDMDEPAGEFESAYELLTALEDLGYEFDEVGITGYPEGHAFLDEETLWAAMKDKEPFATYLVTQICYEPEAIVQWTEAVRDHGVELPIHVGVPGVMKYQRLMNISRRVGVGDSIQYLRKTTGILGFVRQLIGSRGKYTPTDLMDTLNQYADDPAYGLEGVHLYTFNEVPDTETWRREYLNG